MPNMHDTSLPPAAQPIAANASLSMAMVDSGTSLLALPPAMAQAFGEVVLTAAKQAHLPLNASVTDGICFQGVTINEAAVALPPLTFVFGNSVNVTGEHLTWLWHGCRCHAAAQAAWCATRTGAVESCRLPAVQCCVRSESTTKVPAAILFAAFAVPADNYLAPAPGWDAPCVAVEPSSTEFPMLGAKPLQKVAVAVRNSKQSLGFKRVRRCIDLVEFQGPDKLTSFLGRAENAVAA